TGRLLRLSSYAEPIRSLSLSVKGSRAMRTSPPLAVLGVGRCCNLRMDGLFPHLRPQPARHASSAAVLAGLDVMEVRHLLVEDGVADCAGGVFGGQHDYAFALDEPGVEAGGRGPGGEVGGKPLAHILSLDF